MTPGATLVAVLAMIAVATSCSDAAAEGEVDVTDVWARRTPPGVSVGAVYLRVEGADGDVLIGASVDPSVAATTQLHATTSTDGMATMVERVSMPVPADGTLVLEPIGDHIMLVDLATSLDAGETFPLELQFADAGRREVTVEVRAEAP